MVVVQEGGLHAWDANWRTVYELAEVVIDRVVSNFIGRNVSDEIHATSTPMAAADRGLQARL